MTLFIPSIKIKKWLPAFLFLTTQFSNGQISAQKTETYRPKIVILLAYDLGYSDLGLFGSEKNS